MTGNEKNNKIIRSKSVRLLERGFDKAYLGIEGFAYLVRIRFLYAREGLGVNDRKTFGHNRLLPSRETR